MMFVILCYDVNARRDARIRKLVMKYLHPLQRSVFEGELTDKRLRMMKSLLASALDPETDSITIYCMENVSGVRKTEIGSVLPENDYL